jgi:pimeloyl-ACP methyl ester carboxylesterase
MNNKKFYFRICFICCVIFILVMPVLGRDHIRSKHKRHYLTSCSLENCQMPGKAGCACCGPVMPASYSSFPVHVNKYGDIIESYVPSNRGPIIEKIMLYPKLTSGVHKRITRNAMLTRYKEAQATILICHGFMCDKIDSGLLRSLFPRGKFNFMTFDFRAHGDCSDGQCCTLGRDEKYDVIAAARFLKDHVALTGKPIIVYGFSMGAVAAIEAQAKDNALFSAMILDCPFESTENVLKRSLDSIKFSLFGYEFALPGRGVLQRCVFHPYVQSLVKIILRTITQWDPKNVDVTAYPITPVESVKKISVPVFYISCKRDEKVSVDAIKALFQSTSSGYKQLWITNGRRHFDSFFYNPEQYSDRVRQFVLNFIAGKTQATKHEVIQDNDDLVAQVQDAQEVAQS